MPTLDVDVATWFDTLQPIDPPRFNEDHAGWCLRHYAPAIRLTPTARQAAAAGVGATVELAVTLLSLIIDKLPAGSTVTAGQIRDYLNGHSEPWCCVAGDDLVYRIWSNHLPSGRNHR